MSERKVIEYKLVEDASGVSGSNSKFEEKVNAAIKQGWQPLGGVASGGGSGQVMTQAMVKYS